jgi:hypothetical protein
MPDQAASDAGGTPLRAYEMRDYVDAAVKGHRDLSDERVANLRAYAELRWKDQERAAEQLALLLTEKFAARDHALALQHKEYERRLEALNHEHARLHQMSATYVRLDIYEKDMERLYTERREQQAQAEAVRVATQLTTESARVTQEVAATANRRSTMIGGISAMVGVLAVAVSILLRVVPVGTP